MNLLSIGRFARLSGLTVRALRFYGELGLLPPERVDPETGYRLYSPEQLVQAAAIRRLRSLELGLDEIRELLAAPDAVSERLRAIATRKLPEVDALIERARLVRSWLEAAADCRCPTLTDCPLFDPEEIAPAP